MPQPSREWIVGRMELAEKALNKNPRYPDLIRERILIYKQMINKIDGQKTLK